MNTVTMRFEGMHCEGCAERIVTLLEKEPGVRDAAASVADGQTRVRYNPQAGHEDRLVEVVEGAGFSVLADALAGAVFGLARLRDVWAQYGVRPFEAALALVRMLRDGRPEEEEVA